MNCYESALADFLGIPAAQVPKFQGEGWSDQVRRFLRRWGIGVRFVPGEQMSRAEGYAILSYILPNGKTHAELLLDGEAKGIPVLWTIFERLPT